MVKNPLADAGDMGSIPGPGKAHMLQSKQACEPQLWSPHILEPALPNKRSRLSEKPERRNQRVAPTHRN